MNDNEVQDSIEDLQTKLAFQEDLIQKLDDALSDQQQQLMEMNRLMTLLVEQLKMSGSFSTDSDDAPPPHY
jgi:SlyX protein